MEYEKYEFDELACDVFGKYEYPGRFDEIVKEDYETMQQYETMHFAE